jgi:hypothetical protein
MGQFLASVPPVGSHFGQLRQQSRVTRRVGFLSPLRSLCRSFSFAPFGACLSPTYAPTACAVGCILTPLRACRRIAHSNFFEQHRAMTQTATGLGSFISCAYTPDFRPFDRLRAGSGLSCAAASRLESFRGMDRSKAQHREAGVLVLDHSRLGAAGMGSGWELLVAGECGRRRLM